MFRPVSAASAAKRKVRIAIDDFKNGVWTLVDESRLPTSAVKEAVNLIQTQDGRWSKRPGTATYGADLGDTIDSAFQYVQADGDTELLAIAGGTLSRLNISAGTTTAITGATYTQDIHTFAIQISSRTYLANGTDNLTYYDGSVIQPYTTLTQPGSVSVAKTTLTTGSVTPYYQVVALNAVGHSLPSAATTISGGINKTRTGWTSTEKLTVTWASVSGATRYEIYYNEENTELYYLDSVAAGATTYEDTGAAQLNTLTTSPIDNTSQGPKFAHMEISGQRIWATGNPNDPSIVYFGGLGAYQGAFSAYYGGGFVAIEKGGSEQPKAVTHFRDGKGSSQITVFTSSPEGTGSIHQVELVDTTVGDTSFVIPSPIKIVGGVGTNAPLGIIKAGDSILFINKRGVFSLGSKPNLLNVLSTREISSNIRPFIRAINGANFHNICGYYLDGKCYWSVPYGSSTVNNVTMVLDTERNNWNPRAFTLGFKKFLEYTDSEGSTHFLAIPVTGTKLIEISDSFQGDQGEAFETSLISGLYPVSGDRLEWARFQDVVFELYQPQGTVSLKILGTEKRRGFSSLSSISITSSISDYGMGDEAYGDYELDNPEASPSTYSLSSLKRRIRVNKLLNNWQYQITTSGINDSYSLLSVQPRGKIVSTRDPSSWRSTT